MSAIAGAISLRGSPINSGRFTSLELDLAQFGKDHLAVEYAEGGWFARALRLSVPEDRWDQQPLVATGCVLLFAGRIDNRQEIEHELCSSTGELVRVADSRICFEAWLKWDEKCLDRLIGDFAVAFWNAKERVLTLARSQGARRPLFYHERDDTTFFASSPSILTALGAPKALDLEGFAHALTGTAYEGRTSFAGISALHQGEVIRFSKDAKSARSLWDGIRLSIDDHSLDDVGAKLRAELVCATLALSRRHEGPIASTLSAGRDSSAVTAVAAEVAGQTGEVVAITSAPRANFDGPIPLGGLADESGVAESLVRQHSNVRHIVARTSGEGFRPLLDQLHRLNFAPILNPVGIASWPTLYGGARSVGASVLLIGSTGNLSISAGGSSFLADLIGSGQKADRAALFRIFRNTPFSGWRDLLVGSLWPWAPPIVDKAARWITGRPLFSVRKPFLRAPLRNAAQDRLRSQKMDFAPEKSSVRQRINRLRLRDNAELFSLAHWGLDLRDPTGDQRVVRSCLAIPPRLLASAPADRPVYEAAFRGLVPHEVLRTHKRGYQTADWYETFTPQSVKEAFDFYATAQIVRDHIDLDKVNSVIASWPVISQQSIPMLAFYRHDLLETLSLASFLFVHFGD